MGQPSVCICTPLHDGRVHMAYAMGALKSVVAFGDRVQVLTVGGSFLPRNRDVLSMMFLNTKSSHMLFVDSDIGWEPNQLQKLLDTGKDVVSGVYCKKSLERALPFTFTDKIDGELRGATMVPGGFLLISRACIERMVGAYKHMIYDPGFGNQVGLAYAFFEQGFTPGKPYHQEDGAFCVRWTAIGGDIWVHPGVVLEHHGDLAFKPKVDERGHAVLS